MNSWKQVLDITLFNSTLVDQITGRFSAIMVV